MFAPPHCAFILTLPARKHLASPYFGILSTFFFVPRKVRFLAMIMSEQVRHCSFGLTKTFFSRSLKSAFSRHDNVRASSTLFIWLNENVLLRFSKSAFSRHDNVRASSTLFIWLNENVAFWLIAAVRSLPYSFLPLV